jgi:CRISPR/Cas system Type II protein with McrA/HNH and RuvC-like nuclease domain
MTHRQTLYLRQQGHCYYCGCATHIGRTDGPFLFTVDHKLPRSRGGSNRYDNLVGACKGCNNLKGSMTAAEYIKWLVGKNVDALKGRPSIIDRRAMRRDRKRRAKEALAHLPASRKPALPKPHASLDGIFSASLAEFLPKPLGL